MSAFVGVLRVTAPACEAHTIRQRREARSDAIVVGTDERIQAGQGREGDMVANDANGRYRKVGVETARSVCYSKQRPKSVNIRDPDEYLRSIRTDCRPTSESVEDAKRVDHERERLAFVRMVSPGLCDHNNAPQFSETELGLMSDDFGK